MEADNWQEKELRKKADRIENVISSSVINKFIKVA